jgi:hypothetical protein
MSVKSFKFVSPGVFINEIDNSFHPRRPDAIGPVIIGRAAKGPAMQPIKVESYSDFVQVFGGTVAGNAGGDVYRDGNYQTPMYGTYAAKAFLNSNVAPLTYIRLLGQQNTNAVEAGYAGWETTKNPAAAIADNGGAYGLWLFESSSAANLGTGTLAAVWYIDSGSQVLLSGTYANSTATAAKVGAFFEPDSSNNYTVEITESAGGSNKYTFNFASSEDKFIRKVFNTNPLLGNTNASDFYSAASEEAYWLGESFEQEVGNLSYTVAASLGIILPIAKSTLVSEGPQSSREGLREAGTGWIVGQDLGAAGSYVASAAQKLFRLVGRKHGEWLNKNTKVSIERIKPSTTNTSDYGSFSVVVRALRDTDNKVVVIERFDNLNLNPTSENFIARVIGDVTTEWNSTERTIRSYGEYPNNSKLFYVEMEDEAYAGLLNAKYLPFGYHGPNAYSTVANVKATGFTGTATDFVVTSSVFGSAATLLSDGAVGRTGSFGFPSTRLRASSSDGGLFNEKNAYFGMQTTRTPTSTVPDGSAAAPHRYWPSATTPAYYFTMDDLQVDSTGTAVYVQGSRVAGTSRTATSGSGHLLEDDSYNRFTAPVWGGFDGVNILKPDPFYNDGMSSATELTNYAYNTYKQAIDTVADPDLLDMNLLSAPGLTNTGLTTMMIEACEDRADALALIDLPNVYKPVAEGIATRTARVVGNATTSAIALRTRQIDSSYGATFFPWVQTLDERTGQLLWVPPTVAMMGVMASSERSAQVWFAPAGFNRGGLSDGAAGIPISNVSQRLSSKERDTLYDARINPIASFPSSGIVVFGQKTLQERPSALDRINVRRLVIYLKKQISILSTQILFEQNVQATWNRFKGLVEPFLANVKVQFGISDYRLILDESTTTPDLVDQNIMYAKIMVKPARAIEYIAIDFVVASTGASFDD